MKWIESTINGPTWVRALGAGAACMFFAAPFLLVAGFITGSGDQGAVNWAHAQRLLTFWLLSGGAGAALLLGHDFLKFVLEAVNEKYRREHNPAEPRPGDPIDAAVAQSLSEAELRWRSHERWVPAQLNEDPPVPGLPERPIWPDRAPSLAHPAGGTQCCVHCLDEVPVPYTLCDPCGARFSTYFRQHHGVDLAQEQLV